MKKRRDVNLNKLVAICEKYNYNIDDIYTKEKYGRFDIHPYKGTTNEMLDELLDLEEDSLNRCQTCGRLSMQFRNYQGWYTHHCLWHHIIYKIKRFFRILKRKLWLI